VSFAAITLCVDSQRVFIIIVVYFVIESVRKLLVTLAYLCLCVCLQALALSFSRKDPTAWRLISVSDTMSMHCF
jgi:hypothetical protein